MMGGVELLFDIRKFCMRHEEKFFTESAVAFHIEFASGRIPTILQQDVEGLCNRFAQSFIEIEVERVNITIVVV